MDISQCVPKDKSDLAAVALAKTAGYPALNEVLPQLLEWLRDMNWPVAPPVAKLLSGAGMEIVPHIKDVLYSDDHIWKYWLLAALIPNLKPEAREALQADVFRIAHHPSNDEKDEEVDVVARETLALYDAPA